MTQEEKNLLLKDLCGRLPYGVKLHCYSNVMTCIGPYTLDTIVLDRIFNKDTEYVPFDEVKPYLFPLESMTEEQEMECQQIKHSYYYDDDSFLLFDWYNKNHFDYRGLLEKGLAVDATDKNIY